MAGIEEFQIQENELWTVDVQNNLTHLTENIGNLLGILIRLKENNSISQNEIEIIQNESTTMAKNLKLLITLKSKGWSIIKPLFIKILRETTNAVCADLIENHKIPSRVCLLIGVIDRKWWPEKLNLPTSFFDRKNENELLTDKLKKMLTQNENKITVINQQVAVSGFGGIGKTTTAKSFAVKYAEYYELILWIDCGEGSLIKSFTKLARDLDLPKREELELKELACRSFEILKEFKCLFIFDNAECYVGKEGIRDVLPKNHDNFHVIITSRNRHWGQENIDGQIPEFQLDVFGEDEGLDFMKKNIKNLNKNGEIKIKKICLLLGYLPLALQIAVATLNEHEISLDTYIQELQTKDDVLHSELDGYERTINKTLKITLELIQKHKRKNVGELAIKILSIFGYISPDAVDSAFFVTLLQRKEEIDDATDLLQFYSIISKSKLESMTLSIHRLFQQVIRYSTKETKIELLRQIFSCEGFLEYKLIPFTLYADKELQKEFPNLKAKLIDKLILRKLLIEKRFQEAVELSRLINDSIQTPVSVFNFALCLKYNHESEEAKKILQELLKKTNQHGNINEIDVEYYSLIIDSKIKRTFDYIVWELFLLSCEEKDEEAARQMFLSATQIKLSGCSFNSSFFSLLPQSLQKQELKQCTISNGSSPIFGSIPLPPQLKELNLQLNKFMNDEGKELTSLDISQLIPLNLKKLDISGSVYVSLDRLKLIPSVHLMNCSLILVPGFHITPEELTLKYITFCTADKEPIGNVLVNDFVDFRQMKKLTLIGSGMSIDLCDYLTLNDLYLNVIKVLDGKKANWTLHKLQLWEVDFVDKTGMKVTEMLLFFR